MNRITQYYYEQLNKEDRRVYTAIREGLEQMQTSFSVPVCDRKTLSDIYFKLRMDHPGLFYSLSFQYRYYNDSSFLELVPRYLFPKDKLREHKSAMESRISRLARQAETLDEAGKERFIHDFICQNVRYDKLEKEYSHEIIGALGNGVAVCEGIAKAVKVLCDALGIWCIVALAENNPEKKIKYRHAWNVLKLGGKYYHLDATFDLSLMSDGLIRYDYYNLADKQIFRDHEPLVYPVPPCEDGSRFFYKENKLSWTGIEDVRNRTKTAVKKNRPLVFHWRGGYLTRQILGELMEMFSEEAGAKGKRALISVNWSQAVLMVCFEDRPQASENAGAEPSAAAGSAASAELTVVEATPAGPNAIEPDEESGCSG